MSLPDRIPVYLLSGFLGSGKSTLLNDLLDDPLFADTAVVINEFGDVPVDHLLVRRGETAIRQVSTGCLCCSGSTDLRATLFDLHCAATYGLYPPFSRVILEMSGLGDPAPLVNALVPGPQNPDTLRDRMVDTAFHLAGFVTLFDIVTGPISVERHFEALKQVAFADRIVLTKTDLARDPATLADLAALPGELSILNASALILDRRETGIADLFVPRSYSAVDRGEDVAGWLALEAALAAESSVHQPAESRNFAHSRHGAGIHTFSLIRSQPIPEKRFHQFLAFLQQAAGPRLLRVKGLVSIAEDHERPRIIHAVQHIAARPSVLDAWPDDDRRTRLVFITNDIDPEPVRDLFEAVIEGSSLSITEHLSRLKGYLLSPFSALFEHLNDSPRRWS